ncbi:unnamed protein product, partial [Musa acuminata subsp. burmannicoides]
WKASQEGVSPVPTNSLETADAPNLRRSQSPSDIVTSATAFRRLHMPRLCLLNQTDNVEGMENVLALPCQGPLGTANEEEPPSVDGAQRWPQTEATGDASNGKGKHDEAEQGMLHTNRIG